MNNSNSCRRQDGFSLVEATVAAGVMASALLGVAQMFAIAISSNQSAATLTYTTILAEQKMEALRGLAWTFDALGQPVSDAALLPSPAGTMTSSTPGWVDYIDRFGRVVGEGAAIPPDTTVYIRRWAVEPLPSNPANTIAIHVLVSSRADRGAADRAGSTARLPGESRIVTVKTRKAP